MSHSNVGQTNFIGTHESVYRDSPIGNLEKIRFVENVLSPLQQGFYSNIEACLPIGVDHSSAFLASEQGIICTTVSLPNSTAVRTELGCMPRINDIQRNILVKAPLNEILLEGKERNTHDFSIESFAFGTEPFEVLNGDVSIISQSHLSNVPNDFAYSVLDEVMFISFEPLKCLFSIFAPSVSITLQSRLSLKDFLSTNPNVFPEVILMQNLAFRRDNGNSKAFAVHINSKNVLLHRQFSFFFGKIRNNLKIWSESICLASPSVFKKVGISLEIPIFDNRERNGILGKQRKLHKRHSHVKGLAVARNIEFEGNSLGLSLASPHGTLDIADYLRIERGALLG